MEMTIEKAHRILSNGLLNAPSEHEWCMAFKMAIEILLKYQKIVSIVSLNDEEFKQCGLKELKEILEVIADGNVD